MHARFDDATTATPNHVAASLAAAQSRVMLGHIGRARAALSGAHRRVTLRAPMPSLLQVLHDATGHGATELVLEPGRRPTLRTNLGVESMPTPLSEGDLFDALGGVLGPDQQAELAVGNVVEFQLHDGLVRWHLVAQAGADGVVVRGRTGTGGDVVERGVPLELPPLGPNRPEGEAVAIPAAPPRRHRDTAWDLPSVTSTPPPTPSGSIPEWLVSSASRADSTDAGVRLESDSPDFAMRRRPPTGEPPATLGDALEFDPPAFGTVRASDPFAELAESITEPCLCLARGHGHGERLARHLGPYALILHPAEAQGHRVDAHVAAIVNRLEGPSELLGWALRRVEEGGRVIVEVHARSCDAARRVVLGVRHGSSAGEWLLAVPTFWLSEDHGVFTITRE